MAFTFIMANGDKIKELQVADEAENLTVTVRNANEAGEVSLLFDGEWPAFSEDSLRILRIYTDGTPPEMRVNGERIYYFNETGEIESLPLAIIKHHPDANESEKESGSIKPESESCVSPPHGDKTETEKIPSEEAPPSKEIVWPRYIGCQATQLPSEKEQTDYAVRFLFDIKETTAFPAVAPCTGSGALLLNTTVIPARDIPGLSEAVGEIYVGTCTFTGLLPDQIYRFFLQVNEGTVVITYRDGVCISQTRLPIEFVIADGHDVRA